MAKEQEWSEDTSAPWWENARHGQTVNITRALTELEALVDLAPGQQPRAQSLTETHRLREAVANAVAALPEEDEWVFNVLTVAGLSLRFVGSILGVPKTTLARRRDTIYRQLMNDLETHPEVQKWLANRTRPTAPQ